MDFKDLKLIKDFKNLRNIKLLILFKIIKKQLLQYE